VNSVHRVAASGVLPAEAAGGGLDVRDIPTIANKAALLEANQKARLVEVMPSVSLCTSLSLLYLI
jgi:hypothetical protein